MDLSLEFPSNYECHYHSFGLFYFIWKPLGVHCYIIIDCYNFMLQMIFAVHEYLLYSNLVFTCSFFHQSRLGVQCTRSVCFLYAYELVLLLAWSHIIYCTYVQLVHMKYAHKYQPHLKDNLTITHLG